MAWADVEYTGNITGVVVTESHIAQAQGHIELFSGVTEDYVIKARDVRHLRMAVAYQAAFVKGQIDLHNRTDVSQVTQDEMSLQYANAEAPVLAPLARVAIKRLSWKGNRSVRTPRPQDAVITWDPEQEFVTDTGGPPYRPLGS
jgi:hypothetical protein